MKLLIIVLLGLSASRSTAQLLAKHYSQEVISGKQEEQKYLIEFTNGERKWVTEPEKWRVGGDGRMFMDITDFQDLGTFHTKATKKDKFPKKAVLQSKVKPLLKDLTKENIKANLEIFSSFHNRFYKSDYGAASSRWLFAKINGTIRESGADKLGVTAKQFFHAWDQPSIIVTIPGKTNATVVIGAHQDSINYTNPFDHRAPGADDDGSGTVTILEVLRVLLSTNDLVEGKATNTIEFHWYAAEEGGLLGSQAIFSEYEKSGKDVKAMFQQDMTGFVNLTIEAGKRPEFGIMMDFYDDELVDFTKLIIEEYTDISWVETICGGCGSDHMSAHRAGYPAVFVIEADFENCDNHLHGSEDLIKYLDFDHMIDHAQMTLGLVYELAFAKL